MKIEFLVPPVVKGKHAAERSSGCTRVVYPTPNIYELTLAACVEEAGYAVSYVDCVNHGISMDGLQSAVTSTEPDVVVIWTVNLSVENDIEVSRRLLGLLSGLRIVLVGPGASYFYRKCLIDERLVVVHGEPEVTLLELLGSWRDGKDWRLTDGISYLLSGRIDRTKPRALMKDLDSLPIPARHFIEGVDYRNPKLKVTPYTTMVTSRNCPFRCIYCVPSSLTFARELDYRESHENRKPPISFRSPSKVREEIRLLHEQGYRAIGFMDDEFIWNEKRTEEICGALRDYGMVWGCQARVDAITDRIAQLLSESGCRYVDLGVESFNDEILEYIHKGITEKQIYESIGYLQKWGVPVKLNILIGTSPLETKETIRDTIRKAKSLKVDQLMINIVSPFPGTEFYKMAQENGWIKGGEYVPTDVQRESILNYPHLRSEDMERLLFESNLSYFLSPRFVLKQLSRFRSFADFRHAFRSLCNKLFAR